MHPLERAFAAAFSHWEITLPPGTVERRERGRILEQGWAIWYLVAEDEQGLHLDYYAAHRMTDDRHVRLREGHEDEHPGAIHGTRLASEDPAEDARLEAAYRARNRAVARMLEAKGFGLAGDEPGGVAMNRALHLG
jgi:hypothetical protein